MDALNLVAALAAVILGVELFVVTLLLAAICFGIWFGLRFAERKAQPAFDKIDGYVTQARAIERKALGFVVKPLIEAHAFGEMIGVTIAGLAERTRERD
ncbi:MAG TPA: hypothetical protein VG815_16900 [Chloroflexota bacterium]|jgi:hypothetical protein|nr:hypothetical protein [Chloroflexota bacterium]